MSLADCLAKINQGKPVFNQKEIEELKALVRENARLMPQEQAEKAAVQTLLDEAVAERKQIDALVRDALPAVEDTPVIEEPVEPTVKNELFQEPRTERRESKEERRLRYKNMSPDEYVAELERRDVVERTSYLTGLPNRMAYDENDRKAIQASADIDGMKGVNDTLGHPAGDSLIRAKADALKAAAVGEPSISVYHISGDEFVAEADTVEEIDRVMNAARKELVENGFKYVAADGTTQTKKGIGFSYGTDKTFQQADANLKNDKAARKAAGLRTGERDVATRDAGTEAERTGAGNERNERPAAEGVYGRPANEDGSLVERRTVKEFYQSAQEKSVHFYSKLSRAIDGAPDKVFTTGKQVRQWIESNQSKLGIKDETFWSGVTDWLGTQDKVTKADVLAHLDANGVQVEVVMLVEKGGESASEAIEKKYSEEINDLASDSHNEYWYKLLREEAKKKGVELVDLSTPEREELLEDAMSFDERVADAEDNLGRDMRDAIEREITERAAYDDSKYNDTKFASYQLPGGENYKEMLLMMPTKPNTNLSRVEQLTQEREAILAKPLTLEGADESNRQIRNLETQIRLAQKAGEDKAQFKSSHFDQPNILAHIRFNERVDADGNKVLFIEEIQSDWGQKGKKDGFAEKQTKWPVEFSNGDVAYYKTEAEANRVAKERNGTATKAEEVKGIPAAPFVQDTKSWTSLALKRIIAHAVDNGFQKIAWTTGEQQAARYDLSKQISKISYEDSGDGRLLKAEDLNGKNVIMEKVVPEKLPDFIGKDAAEKLLSSPEKRTSNGNKYQDISGLDLKVGGEGMKGYYDQIVTQVANEILRKIGGKVESILFEIPVQGGKYDGLSPAQMREANRVNGVEPTPQQGFTITESMRNEIKAKGMPLFQENLGSFDPETNTLTLLEGANLSTALHELAHWFFSSDIADASKLVQKEFLTKGELKVVEEMHSLFNFYGLSGDLNEQLRAWHSMDFEQQRGMHETFAESFEMYLLKGKAPSIELQSLFQSFSDFVLSVYKSAKELLRKRPLSGKLNPELTRYFDRMLATEEQIELAEQSRSMMPLFKDLGKSGLSPEAFTKYHEEGKQTSQSAIEELRSKAVSDLGWIRGAYGKEVAKLQKKALEARREVRIEAHRDVMTQPISIAWRFLTKRLTADDKIYPVETPKSDYVDETVDSLFVAIAKLGGIDKDETIATWGTDKADKPASGKFGKPVWRIEGGRSLDAMAEVLGQYGYLERDENGKVDLHQFEEMFAAELSGDTQHSIAFEYKSETRAGDQVKNPEALGAARIDIGDLLAMGLPDEIVDKLKANGMTAQTGLAPDLIAEIQGFESGDELMRALAGAESPTTMIERVTDQRMLEQHGELSSPEQISQAADIAIHNKVRAKMIITEANAMAVASGNKKLELNAAKILVANQIAEIKIRDLRPSMYANAAARAAKLAEKAFKKGDSATTYAEKRNQLINTLATKSAYDVREDVEKALKYTKKITSETALKNMRGDAKAQLLAVLDRFDLRKSVTLKELDKEQSIADWAKSEAKRLAAPAPILSEQVLNDEVRTHYKNLTVQEFRGLIDSLEQLEHMARREHKAYIAIRNMSFQEEIGNSIDEIRTAWPNKFDADGNAKKETMKEADKVPSAGKIATKLIQKVNAQLIAMEELVDQLTAGKFGLLHDSLFGRLSNASDKKSIMAGEIRDRLKPFYDAYSIVEKKQFAWSAVGDTRMTREGLLMMQLYWGNVEGRQRLVAQGYTEPEVMQLLSHLTEKDINLAEAIWSLNDEYIWPQYAALNERTQGIAPPKVQAVSMVINGRTIKGGYVKLVYDGEFDNTTMLRDGIDAAMAMISGSPIVTKTNQGSSKTRITELKKPLLLKLSAVSQSVNEHMHDIAFREAVADTIRVLSSDKMANAIKAVSGDPVYKELLAKVNEIAARPRDPSGIVLSGLNIARASTVVNLMSGVKTALVNYSGLVTALFDPRINSGQLIKNLTKVHSWRMVEMVKFAMENSTYMRERNKNYTSDLQHDMASMGMSGKIMPTMGQYLFLMRFVDQLTATTVWISGYEKGMETFKDHDRAAEYANNVTRSTQGAGREVDTSKILQRYGDWAKMFTMFHSFANRALALMVRNGVISKQLWQSGRKAEAVQKFTVAYISIVIIPALIQDLATGKCDEALDGNEDFTRCISKSIALGHSWFFPVVRDLAPYAWSRFDDQDPNFGLRITPATSYLEGVIRGFSSTWDVAQGEGDEKDTKAIFMGLTYTFSLPGLLMWNTMAGTESVINDDAPLKSVLFGPPKEKQ